MNKILFLIFFYPFILFSQDNEPLTGSKSYIYHWSVPNPKWKDFEPHIHDELYGAIIYNGHWWIPRDMNHHPSCPCKFLPENKDKLILKGEPIPFLTD